MIRGPYVRLVAAIVCGAPAAALGAQAPAAQTGAAPPPVVTLTVDEAVQEALDHNLTLMAERFNVSVAEAAVVTASLRPNPVVTFDMIRPDRVLTAAGLSATEQVARTDVVFERGGKRERRVEAARLARSVAELQLLNTVRTLVLDVQQAFTDVQLAKLNLALARENLDAFESVVRINTDRVRAGDLSSVELSRSRLAALQFQNEVRQQETRLRVARNRLSTLIGRGPNGDLLDVAGELRRDAARLELAPLVAEALERRPDLQAARADQARSTADLRLQIANGKVDYTVSGEYHRQSSADLAGNAYAVSFSAPLPIFNRNQGEIARASAQQRQLDGRVRALEAEIANELASAYADYTTARDIVATIEQQMLAEARQVRATTEYSYRAGEASFLEFLDAVRAFNETMQSYNEARAAYARSLYALDALTGKAAP